MTKPIRILLVDDHLVVRKGILLVLDNESDLLVVGEAETGEEALVFTAREKPDIVLMDIQMKGMDGIETTRALINANREVRVIGLSTFANREVVSGMIEAGARGYLLKDVSANDLTDAIRRTHAGETLLPQAQLAQENKGINPAHCIALGKQQNRVLALMTKGFTNPEIAEKMSISTSTARYHVSAILHKLDVSKRSEAVAIAIRMGIVDYNEF